MQIRVCYPIEVYQDLEVPDGATRDEIFEIVDIYRVEICENLAKNGYDIESGIQEWEKLEDDDANGWDWEIPENL